MVSDRDTRENRSVCSDPYLVPDRDRRGDQISTLFRIKMMIQRCQDYVVADQRVVSDRYTALVLKLASGVDENIFSHMDVFPAVRIERRKQAEAVIHPGTGQL